MNTLESSWIVLFNVFFAKKNKIEKDREKYIDFPLFPDVMNRFFHSKVKLIDQFSKWIKQWQWSYYYHCQTLMGGEITHDDNWEAVYGCEDEPNISCNF